MSIRKLFAISLAIGVVVFVGCWLWNSTAEEGLLERSARSHAQLQETVRAMQAGEEPKELQPPTAPWPARNFVLSGIIAFVVVLAAGRVLIFFNRLESQSRS